MTQFNQMTKLWMFVPCTQIALSSQNHGHALNLLRITVEERDFFIKFGKCQMRTKFEACSSDMRVRCRHLTRQHESVIFYEGSPHCADMK